MQPSIDVSKYKSSGEQTVLKNLKWMTNRFGGLTIHQINSRTIVTKTTSSSYNAPPEQPVIIYAAFQNDCQVSRTRARMFRAPSWIWWVQSNNILIIKPSRATTFNLVVRRLGVQVTRMTSNSHWRIFLRGQLQSSNRNKDYYISFIRHQARKFGWREKLLLHIPFYVYTSNLPSITSSNRSSNPYG